MSADGLDRFRERLTRSTTRSRACSASASRLPRVAHYKSERGIPTMQPERVAQVRERYLARGEEADLPAEFMAELLSC